MRCITSLDAYQPVWINAADVVFAVHAQASHDRKHTYCERQNGLNLYPKTIEKLWAP